MKEEKKIMTNKYCPFKSFKNREGQHRCDKNCALYYEETLYHYDGSIYEKTEGCSITIIAGRIKE